LALKRLEFVSLDFKFYYIGSCDELPHDGAIFFNAFCTKKIVYRNCFCADTGYAPQKPILGKKKVIYQDCKMNGIGKKSSKIAIRMSLESEK
jgi:hypothetical protein